MSLGVKSYSSFSFCLEVIMKAGLFSRGIITRISCFCSAQRKMGVITALNIVSSMWPE